MASPAGVATLAAVLMATAAGCATGGAATPTPRPQGTVPADLSATPISTVEEQSPSPGDTVGSFSRDDVGISFRYFTSWSVEQTPAQDGVVATLVSPDGLVAVSVLRDYPPPGIDVRSYGQAMVQTLRLSGADVQTIEEGVTTLEDGTPAYRARVSVSGAEPQSGEVLVAIRGEGLERDAFIVQAGGSAGAYEAWTGPVRLVLRTFRVSAS